MPPDERTAFVVTDPRGRVVLRTDDWVEAERVTMDAHYKARPSVLLRIGGTHPTHEWADGVLLDGEPEFKRGDRCRKCGSPHNGCQKSHAPCGHDISGSWVTVIRRELAARGEKWTWHR